MPYMSRVPLDVSRHRTRALLRNPQWMKNEVLTAIKAGGGEERFLWRLDVEPGNRLALFAVTERTMPNWEQLWATCGRKEESGRLAVRDYAMMLERLEVGQEYAFKLTASPTYSEAGDWQLSATERANGKKWPRGKRRPCRSRVEQLDWLLARANSAGFKVPELVLPSGFLDEEPEKVPDVLLSDTEVKRFRRANGGREGQQLTVTIQRVTYTGRLHIEDEKAMQQTLVSGLGTAKAYGAGLMTLARIDTRGNGNQR